MLVKKNQDGSIIVCQPDGSSCRILTWFFVNVNFFKYIIFYMK
jgi:hypothetical protein